MKGLDGELANLDRELVLADVIGEQPPWSASESAALMRKTIEDAMASLQDHAPLPASWHGHSDTMLALLDALGIPRADNGNAPRLFGIDLIEDPDVGRHMVIECAADGTILRAFARTENNEWFAISGEYVVEPLNWWRRRNRATDDE